MDKKSPSIIKHCKRIWKMSSIREHNKTIYEKAYNEVNIYEVPVCIHDEFEIAITHRIDLYSKSSIGDTMIDKCLDEQFMTQTY